MLHKTNMYCSYALRQHSRLARLQLCFLCGLNFRHQQMLLFSLFPATREWGKGVKYSITEPLACFFSFQSFQSIAPPPPFILPDLLPHAASFLSCGHPRFCAPLWCSASVLFAIFLHPSLPTGLPF